jgi:hypothetical protein
VYDSPMIFTILSGRWVGNTGCPAKSSTKGGHPSWTPHLVMPTGPRATPGTGKRERGVFFRAMKSHPAGRRSP